MSTGERSSAAKPRTACERETLSVCIITHDEERNVGRCLASVEGLADQIVVVDSLSRDRTIEVARAAGAEVWSQEFLGYEKQKQLALEKATGEWILCLDADEWLDADLREAVRDVLRRSPVGIDGYWVDRRPFYLGRWIRHGGWSEWKLRLVRRGHGRWTGGDPHERLEVDGESARLRGRLLHRPYHDLSAQVAKINRYTDQFAKRSGQNADARSLFGMLLEPPLVFAQKYFLQRGILDGVRGFIAAATTAFYFFLKYAKQWERRHGGDGPDEPDR